MALTPREERELFTAAGPQVLRIHEMPEDRVREIPYIPDHAEEVKGTTFVRLHYKLGTNVVKVAVPPLFVK